MFKCRAYGFGNCCLLSIKRDCAPQIEGPKRPLNASGAHDGICWCLDRLNLIPDESLPRVVKLHMFFTATIVSVNTLYNACVLPPFHTQVKGSSRGIAAYGHPENVREVLYKEPDLIFPLLRYCGRAAMFHIMGERTPLTRAAKSSKSKSNVMEVFYRKQMQKVHR